MPWMQRYRYSHVLIDAARNEITGVVACNAMQCNDDEPLTYSTHYLSYLLLLTMAVARPRSGDLYGQRHALAVLWLWESEGAS